MINLDKVKIELEKEGYQTLIRPLYEYGNCIDAKIPSDNENASLDAHFRILIIENQFLLDFGSQVRKNKYFDTKDSLIDHIKEIFPL
jgi:hypothetical protein